MLAKRRFLFSIFFVLLSLLVEQLSVAATSKKGVVQGTREANLRVGPGVEHGVKGIVKENEQVTVEGQEGDWYLVETAAGQRGYLHKNFIKLVGEEQAGTVVTEPKTVKAAADESKETNKAPATDTSTTEQRSPPSVLPQKIPQPALPPASPNQPAGATRKTDESRTSSNKAPSLIELLEGREGD